MGEVRRGCAELQEALSGLSRVQVSTGQMRDALLKGGAPVTPVELVKRFEGFVQKIIRGQDAVKVRIVLE